MRRVCVQDGIPTYLGCSVHCQQSTRTKSTNGGQVYNNTTFSVWCVCVEGRGGKSVGHVAPVSPVQHPRQEHMSHLWKYHESKTQVLSGAQTKVCTKSWKWNSNLYCGLAVQLHYIATPLGKKVKTQETYHGNIRYSGDFLVLFHCPFLDSILLAIKKWPENEAKDWLMQIFCMCSAEQDKLIKVCSLLWTTILLSSAYCLVTLQPHSQVPMLLFSFHSQ